jgi:hypothetical protein
MTDPTEAQRRAMLRQGLPTINLAIAQATQQPTWDTEALREAFEVLAFMAPFVVVRRRSDGVKGTLEFTHSPRVYFNWQEDKP